MNPELDSVEYYRIATDSGYQSLAETVLHQAIQQLSAGTKRQSGNGRDLETYLRDPEAFEIVAFFGFLFAHREEEVQFSMDAIAIFTRHSLLGKCGPLKHAISALDEGDFKNTLSIPMQRFIDLLQH